MDIKLHDTVRFRENAEVGMIEGTVWRAPWGTRSTMVTIKTLEDPPRTFVRLASEVTVISPEATEEE